MNPYPNLFALLESSSTARRLYDRASPQVRRKLVVRQQSIKTVAALESAINAFTSDIP